MKINFDPNISSAIQILVDQIRTAMPVPELPKFHPRIGLDQIKIPFSAPELPNLQPKIGSGDFNHPPVIDDFPQLQQIDKPVINAAIDQIVNFPTQTELPDFTLTRFPRAYQDIQKMLSVPNFKLPAPQDAQRFQKILKAFLDTPQNKGISQQLGRYLERFQVTSSIPEALIADIKEINRHLGFYQRPKASQEVKYEFDYYNLNAQKFAKRVFDEMEDNFSTFSNLEQSLILENKARELAPIHPEVLRCVPNGLIEEKNVALLLSKAVEAIHQKVALLSQEKKLHLLEKGQEIKEMLEDGIFRSATWIEEVLEDLSNEVVGLSNTLKAELESLEYDIRIGLNVAMGTILTRKLDHKKAILGIGKSIFGLAFRIKPAFNVKDAILQKSRESLISEGMETQSVDLKQNYLYEQYQAWKMRNAVASLESDNFSINDFLSESKLLNVGAKPLTYGMIANVNGIMNSEQQALEHAKILSKMAGDAEISAIYNASHHFFSDIEETALHLMFESTKPVEILTAEVKEYFEKNGMDKRMLIVCHSQGAAITRNVLVQLPPEIRKRISVLAVAPAAYIDDFLCGHVRHLVSDWDFIVPWVDKAGRERCKDSIIQLKSQGPWWKMDHSFNSPTYKEYIEEVMRKFNEQNK